jgi:molecular chaperone DnaK
MNEHYIGIDLGTTNSVIAGGILRQGDIFTPEAIKVPQLDRTGWNIERNYYMLPSALYLKTPTDAKVGLYARRMLEEDASRVIINAKRYMGIYPEKTWEIDGEVYTPELVSSYYLTILKTAAEENYGTEVDGAIITVPASFNFQQIAATRVAAQIAGFSDEKVDFISEPTAAVLDFLNQEQHKDPKSRRINFSTPQKLLVFDLGGGTCDVSIVEATVDRYGNIDIQEKIPSRYTSLGGTDFDQKLALAKLNDFLMKNNIDYESIERRKLQSISALFIHYSERMKHRLSNDIRDLRNNPKYKDNPEKLKELIEGLVSSERIFLHNYLENVDYLFEVNKKEYDEIISPLLQPSQIGEKNIIDCIESALANNDMSKDEIDHVFLVGSMTEYYTIQEAVKNYFCPDGKGVERIHQGIIDPSYGIAQGAAVYSYYKNIINISKSDDKDKKQEKETQRFSGPEVVVPGTIFIELENEDLVLIEAGTPAPFERTIEGELYTTAPTGMEVKLFQGDRYSVMPFELKKGSLRFTRPQQIGTPVSMHIAFDSNKELKVKAWLTNQPDEVMSLSLGNELLTEEEAREKREKRGDINKVLSFDEF